MSVLPRSFAIFALCIPLALLLGVMLATPLDSTTMLLVGGCFLLLSTPMLLRHHHAVLLFSWNAFVNVFFLPGQPHLWLLMVAVSLFFAVLTRTLNRHRIRFDWLPSIAIPLILFGLITVVTAQLRGGIGLRAMGSDVFGGKRYVYLWGAILLFFALTVQRIPAEKRRFFAVLFFITGISAAFSNMAYTLGPNFYWLFLFFPTDMVLQQVSADEGLGMMRISGLAWTSLAICSAMLVRWGIRGLFECPGAWRFGLFIVMAGVGFFSGFRSHLVLLALILGFQFLAERLWRTRYLFAFGAAVVILAITILPFADSLPMSVQRTLTFIPGIRVDMEAAQDSKNSVDWRVDMWRVVVNDIPKYLIVGKGYSIDPTDLYLSQESVKRGLMTHFDPSLIAGDYHSGPLILIITFGIFGTITFLWFILASLRVLWMNYRYGERSILAINTFVLAYFLGRIVFFLVIYGSLHSDMAIFTGLVGFSIAVNGGLKRSRDKESEIEAENSEAFSRQTDENVAAQPVFV